MFQQLISNRLSLVAFLVAVASTTTEAFQTQNSPATANNKNLSARNAFFGFGEKTAENNNASSGNSRGLIQQAKTFIYEESGFYSAYTEGAISDEFVFRGPIVGPLNKKDYLQTMETFGIYKALPDIDPNAWGFSIDPKDPNRVWFMVRNTGTFTGEPIAPKSINFKPNGAKLEGVPETFSIIFDEDKKVKYLSVGYVADRFEGNTNGKGAVFGIFNVIGLPFPPVGPFQRFAQWLGTEVVDAGAKSYSRKEELPAWWASDSFGADGFL